MIDFLRKLRPLIALIFIAVLAYLLTLLDWSGWVALSPIVLLMVIACQLLALMSAAGSWWAALKSRGQTSSLLNLCVHVSVLQIGKYIPGKVWGLVARGGVLASQNKVHASLAGVLTLLEQLIVLAVGAVLGLSLWYKNLWPLIPAFLCLLLVPHLLNLLSRRPGPARDLVLKLKSSNWQLGWLLLVAGFALLSWLAVVFCLLLLQYGSGLGLTLTQGLQLAGAMVIAVSVGFLAFFSPGGLGVREGVFVVLAAPVIGVNDAAALALAHRLVLLVYDICLGFGLLILLGAGRFTLSSERPQG